MFWARSRMASLKYFQIDEKIEYFYKEDGAIVRSTGLVRFSSLIGAYEVEFLSQRTQGNLWIYNPGLNEKIEKIKEASGLIALPPSK